MALAQFSLTNLGNTFAQELATALLEAGYLVYWKPVDALQTLDGVYPAFYENQSTILADTDVAARFAAARGIVSVLNQDATFPQFPIRPTSDGSVIGPEDVPAPMMALAVQFGSNGELSELGAKTRWRYSDLLVAGYARNLEEQLYLANVLRTTFDESTFVTVLDHAAGTRAPVGSVEIVEAGIDVDTFPLNPDAMAYEVTLSARLRYVA